MSKENLVIDNFYLINIRGFMHVGKYVGPSSRIPTSQHPATSVSKSYAYMTGAFHRFEVNKIVHFLREDDIMRESTEMDQVLWGTERKK